MKIKVRNVCGKKYVEIKVEIDNTIIDLGFHNEKEVKAFIGELKEAIDLLKE